MRLKKAHIRNFRGIADLDLEFSPGFNLLKGENGTGKTSVLEALAVGLGGFSGWCNPGLQDGNYLGPETGKRFRLDDIRKELSLSGDGACVTTRCLPVEITLTAEFSDQNRELTWTRSQDTLPKRERFEGNRVRFEGDLTGDGVEEAAKAMANSAETVLPVLCYQGTGRVPLIDDREQARVYILRKRRNLERTRGYDSALSGLWDVDDWCMDWFARMEQISWQKGRKLREYEAVKRTAAAFLNRMNGDARNGEARNGDGTEAEQREIFYDKQTEELVYRGDGVLLPVFDLSDGLRSLLWMVLDIARRMAMLNPFLLDKTAETPGVVLVDELDLHLHPKWQWRVIDALRETFPHVQFIASTHAPVLFASANGVRLLSLHGDRVSYDQSRYGLDVSDSVTRYQGNYDLPERAGQLAAACSDAMDEEDYRLAAELLDKLERELAKEAPGQIGPVTLPEPPLLVGLRTRYRTELALSGDWDTESVGDEDRDTEPGWDGDRDTEPVWEGDWECS